MEQIIDKITRMQQAEITEYKIYMKLADRIDDKENAKILRSIAEDELKHYNFWNERTNTNIKAQKWKVYYYYFI